MRAHSLQKWWRKVLVDITARTRYFLIFFIPLMVVLVIWLIPIFVMGSIDEEIDFLESKDNLTPMEQTRLTDLQWSKNWWITTKVTVFNPTATLLLIVMVTVATVLVANLLLWKFI